MALRDLTPGRVAYQAAGRVPTVPPWNPANLTAFRRRPLEFLAECASRHGDLFRFHVLGVPMIMVNNPANIEHVLVHNADNYGRDAPLFRVTKPVLGNGLIGSPGGEPYRRQRKLMQPHFRPSVVLKFTGNMTDEIDVLIDAWLPQADGNQVVNVTDDVGQVALRIVNRSLFTAAVGHAAQQFERNFAALNEILAGFFSMPFPPLNTPGRRRRRMREAIGRMHGFVSSFIERRLAGEEVADDLLSMLMSATHDDTNEYMDVDQLRDEVLNLVIGAFETTTNAASWALYLLATHPEAQERLLGEVQAHLGDRIPTYADLGQLSYTRSVVEETLRLYSPAYQTMRQCVADDVIAGKRIPAGANIYLNSYLLHRHPDFWTDPESFDPDRFSPQRSTGRPKHAFIPFGSGPRICIGKHFAMAELQLIVAMIVRRFRVGVPAGQPPVEPQPLVTLHPKDGVRLTLQSR
ncbi:MULTISPECIES: cytochrome P450 [Saccharothrix]|uniref:cytochrome P450 n=1 Tax=Saccharothrix TaxID=2071 RepID=UPI0009394C3E|nr:cytochrome P450 [Saccharothrix sp. CB00851]